VKFPDFSPSGMSVHFIPYRKDKIRTVWKKSGQLVTLYVMGIAERVSFPRDTTDSV
jgi:hypothetical protein